MSEVKLTTILIADDHELFNDGLRTLLTVEGSPYQIIGQVFTGPDVIPAIHKASPDVLLLDLRCIVPR